MGKIIGILFFTISILQYVQAWDPPQADFGGDCRSVRCRDQKNLVCSRSYVCECKIDEINHTPWIYVQKLDRCVAYFRDDMPTIHFPQDGQAYGHNHGGNNIGQPQPRPTSSFGCTSLNTPCSYSTQCQQQYGNLAQCGLHDRDPSLNRCECCHPTEETGFYNGKCQFVKRIGQSCSFDDECILGSRDSRCLRGICQRNNANNTGVNNPFIAITLVISAIFAKIVAN